MARYSLFVLKVPLNPYQPITSAERCGINDKISVDNKLCTRSVVLLLLV